MKDSDISTSQINLLTDAVRIGELQSEINSLEAMLDDPQSAWNLRQSEFFLALSSARQRYKDEQDAQIQEQKRLDLERQSNQPLLQTVHDLIVSGANGDELTLYFERNQSYGVGWWLDIPSPLHLDLSTNPIGALVASAFRAIRLTRFESHLRNKKSRLSQFRSVKKFPTSSGIVNFLDVSESRSRALAFVLTRNDAEKGVAFMLALPIHPARSINLTAKEKSDDTDTFR